MRVLIVEAEEFLAGMVAAGLRRASYAVDVVGDGAAALRRLRLGRYDLLVLDRDLPGLHGDEVCRSVVAQWPHLRVLMPTAAGSLETGASSAPEEPRAWGRVEGLSLGADDCLTEPFAYEELLARVAALGRRAGTAAPAVLECAGLVLGTARRMVGRDGRQVPLSGRECAALEVLLRADGAVVSGEELLARVWGGDLGAGSNAVRITLSRLRARLGEPAVVETVPRAGYRLRRAARS
ncbi:response regulator transcription factor [Streptomyces sp. NPDC048483]|uniref:response regulator transcription factor n=1 Tax=Streptomyces sp. NPDC048483 TaxID=3154927 RepID=UPI0034492A40